MYGIVEHILNHESPEKVFFQVIVDFSQEFVLSSAPKPPVEMIESLPYDNSSFESAALNSYPKAEKLIEDMLSKICSKFPGSMITELTLDQQSDEYHLCIRDESGEEIAKLGIIAIDYRDVTIH